MLKGCLLLTACMHPRSSPPEPVRTTDFILGSVADRIGEHLELRGTLPRDLAGLCRRADCERDYYGYDIREVKDAWGTPFAYRVLSKHDSDLRSWGPDRTEGTEDDIAYSPGRESRKVREISGCYRLRENLNWLPDDGMLRLDTVRVGGHSYGGAPHLRSNRGPFWRPEGRDSVVVDWLGAERGAPTLRLKVSEGQLAGVAFWPGFKKRSILAVKVPCDSSDSARRIVPPRLP